MARGRPGGPGAGDDDAYGEASDYDEDEVLSDDADVYQGQRAAAAGGGGGGGGSSSSSQSRKRGAGGTVAAAAASKAGAHQANGNHATRAAQAAAAARTAAGSAKEKGYAWEATYKRSWDAVREDEGGSLAGAVRGLLEASKRRRTLHDSAPVQRGIIRHLILILDLSESMLEKDLRPSRFLLTLQYAREFVSEFFDQNPIGQLSILGTREGVAERITSMSGNTAEHIASLQSRKLTPRGEPSLQNSLEMARANLAHLPTANSREVLVLFGSLTTCDPGNIHDTMQALARDNVRVSMVCLAAEVRVCKDICKRTHGIFGVALDEGHLRDLLFAHVNPPEIEADDRHRPKQARQAGGGGGGGGEGEDDDYDEGVDLMQMGFPTRLPTSDAPTLCACHNRLKSGGYLCPRCLVKVCDVPTDCPVCGLTIVMSTHLARSYHHLFPVANYEAISWPTFVARERVSETRCFGCAAGFQPLPAQYKRREVRGRGRSDTGMADAANGAPNGADRSGSNNHDDSADDIVDGDADAGAAAAAAADDNEALPAHVAASGRYACPRCQHDFCLECDSFIHESLHQCPGCR